jgi:hypothetical protein
LKALEISQTSAAIGFISSDVDLALLLMVVRAEGLEPSWAV